MIPGIQEIKALALKYSKKQLANMAQTGLIDPQKAVMAGMMRDRIAKEDMQPPTSTVAQDALGLAPAPQIPPQMGMQPPPQMAQAQPQPQPQTPAPQMGAPVQQPPVMAASGGVTSLPVDIADYAGGGIVAFGDGGDVPGYAGAEGSVVRTPRYGMRFEDLPIYSAPSGQQVIQPAGSMGEFFSNIGTGLYNIGTGIVDLIPSGAEMNQSARDITGRSGTAGGFQRIDPVTGKPISFGDFLRLQEAERSQVPVVATAPPPAPAPAPAPKDKRGSRNRGDSTPPPPAPAAPNLGKSVILEAPTLPTSGAFLTPPTIPAPPSLPTFDPNKVRVKGEDLPTYTARERKEIGAARRAAEVEEGVDPEMYSKMIKGVEEKKGKLEKRRGEAGGEALMQFGLGLIGARRGEEFQVASKAGREALGAYKQDVKDLRAAEEKYDERIEALRMSDQQAKLTGARADVAQAEQDRQLAFNSKVDVAKARNDLAKSNALINTQLYGTEAQHGMEGYKTGVQASQQQFATQQQAMSKHQSDMIQAATALHQIKQQAVTAERGHEIDVYRAKLAYSASMYNSSVIKQAGLDERRSRTLIEASDSYIRNNKDNPAYLNNPMMLQQDAMAYANRLAGEFMSNTPAGQRATGGSNRASGNRPSLQDPKYNQP
jgi:hypothetical protein